MAIGVILALMGTACLIQLANIQLINGKTMAQAAAQSRTITVTLKARRGKIMDTNGSILAQSVERYTIIGNPEEAQAFTPTTCTKQTGDNCHQIDGKPVGATGAAAVARLLAPVLDMDATELGAMLSGTGQYAVLKKDVTPAVKRKISKLNLGGIVYAELSNERIYSNGTLMGALLGGVDGEGKGVAGIEQMENKTLTGEDGYQVYQQGNNGVEIPGTMTESKDAVNGSDVTLTIDHDVQWYVEKVLKESCTKYSSPWGVAVVQDTQTGDILALADSDEIEAGSDQAKMTVSRAVSETFEPGSIGKVFTMSGMIQLGLHQASDKFTVPDHITTNGQTYSDATTHGDEHWTLAGILEQSSNVGMIIAAEKMSNEQPDQSPSFKNQFRDNRGEYIQASLSIPIFNSLSRRTNVNRSRNNMLIQEQNRNQTLQQLQSDIRKAVNDCQGYAKQYEQMKKRVEANQLAYDVMRRKYEEGLVSPLDLQTSANLLLSAKADQLKTKLDYIIQCRLVKYYKGIPLIEQLQ